MWKPLASTETVYPGAKLRFNHLYREGISTEALFKVVKTDQHYFEILPFTQNGDDAQNLVVKKFIRYFDIGYNIQLDIWDEKA